MLLIAPSSEDHDPTFARAVILIVDREPNGITSGIVLNRALGQQVVDASALALLFVDDLMAPAYWGGPLGTDPAVLAQFSANDGLEWFHLPKRMRRPFPLPDVGVIAVAEHPEPFENRIVRSRLFVGLCVWTAGQLESELRAGAWRLCHAAVEDVFRADPATLWDAVQDRLVS